MKLTCFLLICLTYGCDNNSTTLSEPVHAHESFLLGCWRVLDSGKAEFSDLTIKFTNQGTAILCQKDKTTYGLWTFTCYGCGDNVLSSDFEIEFLFKEKQSQFLNGSWRVVKMNTTNIILRNTNNRVLALHRNF